jgi:CO/xanthine dehydrogenase FAD-binding subunit
MLPILIALEAEVEVVSPSSPKPRLIGLESWLQLRAESAEFAYASDLILRVYVSLKEGRHAAYRRWNRVSCDLSILGAAAAYEFEGEIFRNVRLALGGFGPKARRFPAIESLFEGKPLLAREAIEEAVSPLLDPIGDLRASAAFKRLRGAQLVADALGDAFAMPEISEARA